MQNPSMDADYCQGISTKDLPFERETRKWNRWKGLAGNCEFSETVWGGGEAAFERDCVRKVSARRNLGESGSSKRRTKTGLTKRA